MNELIDPMELFEIDRKRARDLLDPLVDRCVLATVDEHGLPQTRTLVLRDVDGQHALFFNGTSAKYREIQLTGTVSVLTFFSTIGVQYRMTVELEFMEPKVIASYWVRKPLDTRKLDWLYEDYPQGSRIESRDRLLELHRSQQQVAEMPNTARGYFIRPTTIDRLDLNVEELHDRRRFVFQTGKWICEVLVP